MNITALDLSLTATGYATMRDGEIIHETISPPKGMVGLERINWIYETLIKRLPYNGLIVFENFSFASNDAGSHERIGLAFLLRLCLWQNSIPFLLVAPSQLKKFVTGKGNAEKSLVLREVYRRWGVVAANDNAADAVGLIQIGRCIVGEIEPETEPQREVLAALRKAGAVPQGLREVALNA